MCSLDPSGSGLIHHSSTVSVSRELYRKMVKTCVVKFYVNNVNVVNNSCQMNITEIGLRSNACHDHPPDMSAFHVVAL